MTVSTGYGAQRVETAPAAAAAGVTDGRPGGRGVDPALRAALLAVPRSRPAGRGDRPGLGRALADRADPDPLGGDPPPHRVVRRRRPARGPRAASRADARHRAPGRDRRVRSRACAPSPLRLPGARVARAVRPRCARGFDRGRRRPDGAHAGAPARHRRLRARTRLALRARDPLLRHTRDAAPAPSGPGGHRNANRGVRRRPRRIAGALPGLRVPLLRPGRQSRTLGSPTQEEAQCRRTSCSRRSPFRACRR